MNYLSKCLLITTVSIYITGCALSTPDIITPIRDVKLNLGESAIVHGAMENCAREPRSWSEISHLLPYSEMGFFSNAGRTLMRSEKCGGNLTPVLGVRFTANKVGSENLTVFDDPMNITVTKNSTANVNFLQSAINPEKAAATPKTEAQTSRSSVMKTLSEWIGRGEQ